MNKQLTFGFPRMHVEAGERRDFLPSTIAYLEKSGAKITLEHGYGSGMSLHERDYLDVTPSVVFASHEETYQQDYIVVLRCPDYETLELLKPGSCLISMLHYPTRPERTAFLQSLGIEAISLDSLKDDVKRRLVENLHGVAWNGCEVAFNVLSTIYPSPGFMSPNRDPIRVTLMGSGAVGIHVVQAAIRYGNQELWREMIERGTPGVQVTVVDHDTTPKEGIMLEILAQSDLLVDATQRPDPSVPVIPNDWIAVMPEHAVMLDLSVDPYDCSDPPTVVKGIEGIPHGNLDQYIFAPDDPAFASIPPCIRTANRRYSVSCYSWPGIHPRECMQIYGKQLRPIFHTLLEKEDTRNISPKGRFFERAISRALLSRRQTV